MNDAPKPSFFLPIMVMGLLCAACGNVPLQDTAREAEEIQEIRLSQQVNQGHLNLIVESEMRITRQAIEVAFKLNDTRTLVQQDARELRMETPENLWRQLLRGCELATLERIENGKSERVPGDGADLTLAIHTQQRKLSFLNGHGEAIEQLKAQCLFPLHCAYFHALLQAESPTDEFSPAVLERLCLKPSP
jgi:hypothetical protein